MPLHHGAMFLTDCTACGLRELRGARSIEIFANTDHGPVLGYLCRGCQTPNTMTGAGLGAYASAPARPTVAA